MSGNVFIGQMKSSGLSFSVLVFGLAGKPYYFHASAVHSDKMGPAIPISFLLVWSLEEENIYLFKILQQNPGVSNKWFSRSYCKPIYVARVKEFSDWTNPRLPSIQAHKLQTADMCFQTKIVGS